MAKAKATAEKLPRRPVRQTSRSKNVVRFPNTGRRPLRIDNVTVGNGVPFDVATDEIAGFHFQRIKLVDGAEGGGESVGASAAFGLHVDVKRLPQVDAVLARNPTAVITVTNVGDGSSKTIAASNTDRRAMIIHNRSAVVMWVRLASGATLANASFPIDPGETWEMPLHAYTGIVSAIWEAADAGSARVTEF